jgi:N-acetyl sugar amidotransferase
MDTTDSGITFDADGVCNHCREFDVYAASVWRPDERGERALADMVAAMKKAGEGKEYDCILGLSGGADSSYLALKMSQFGLRMLAVHVDAGWNSETAVHNIERLIEHCGLDLHTVVVNWDDMRDLQLAYFRSGIANQDVPQDHVFFSNLYHEAAKYRIKHVLSGGNIATEGIFPNTWHGDASDAWNLKAINRQFGSRKLTDYRTAGFLKRYVLYPYWYRMRVVRPLNLMPYERDAAIDELQRVVGYKPYGRKHGESHFTRFFQNHYLPTRFGYDKRRPHLASLIASRQMTRDEALAELDRPLYSADELQRDKEYVAKKLAISVDEFDALLEVPIRHYEDFRNQLRPYRMMKRAQSVAERVTRRRLSVYG